MTDWGMYLTIFAIFTGIGFLLALPVLIPPIRGWLRDGFGRGVIGTIIYGLTIYLLLAVPLSYLKAQIQTLYICDVPVFYDTFSIEENFLNKEQPFTDAKQVLSKRYFKNCTDSHATELGFSNEEKMRKVLVEESFKRSITPPFFREDCYQNNPDFCELVDSFTFASSDSAYFSVVVSYLWSIIVAGYFIWRWTRPKRVKLDEGAI